MSREKLPLPFETKYKSESLKEKIADDLMWVAIPSVYDRMKSPKGKQRLQENDLLFTFIDDYFTLDDYVFEPNMRDGRYVFLPDDVYHQGIGVSVSNQIPGFLEVGHFWYPGEFSDNYNADLGGQVYVSMFMMKPDKGLADFIRKIYIEDQDDRMRCTFPFTPDIVVTLYDNFLDNLDPAITQIRQALSSADEKVKMNGEGLIEFMQSLRI